jgi:hypothetical protein
VGENRPRYRMNRNIDGEMKALWLTFFGPNSFDIDHNMCSHLSSLYAHSHIHNTQVPPLSFDQSIVISRQFSTSPPATNKTGKRKSRYNCNSTGDQKEGVKL